MLTDFTKTLECYILWKSVQLFLSCHVCTHGCMGKAKHFAGIWMCLKTPGWWMKSNRMVVHIVPYHCWKRNLMINYMWQLSTERSLLHSVSEVVSWLLTLIKINSDLKWTNRHCLMHTPHKAYIPSCLLMDIAVTVMVWGIRKQDRGYVII
jgi:hypothetical protein